MSSDLASSEVTYTSISSHGDTLAWAVDFFGLHEPDSPEAALASPDYVSGPEEPEQVPPSPDYVPGYVADSDPEEDPEEDFEDGLVDYLADRGDDDDNDDSSNDDEEDEAEEEEEEHQASADFLLHPLLTMFPLSRRRICSRRTSLRLFALPAPPPSPLISLSPPSIEECLARCLATPALPSSLYSPPPVPISLSLLLPTLPPLPTSLFIPPLVERREDIPEVELPPHKRLCLTAPTSRYEEAESSTAAIPTGDLTEAVEEIASMTLEENNMPPKRTSAAARAAAAAGAPMTATVVEQLIKAKVSVPLTFKGTEGVVVLSQWFEKMEPVFHINNYVVENQVKFATCTFLGNALTWWNSHMKTVTQDVTYAMNWKTLKKMMTDKYCPMGEIKKLEIKLWNLKAIEFANDQMDQKVLIITERQDEQKRKLEFDAGNNQGHQQQNKRQNTRKAYTAGPSEKREYTKSLTLCIKYNYHHKGPCAPRCNRCKKICHLTCDCRSSGPNCNNNNRWNSRMTQNASTCFECGVQGHFKRDCSKLKNKNHGNQVGNENAPAKVYVVGNAGTNPDSNVITDHYYDVKLADGKIIGINTIIQGCTLNFLDHLFNIDLMLVELCSFDVIIGMDWLANNQGNETRLNIISCTKTHKYMLKGCHVILAYVTTKETEDKSGEKQLEDVPIIQDFPKNKEEHEEHLKLILELLKKEELYAKFFKCEFWIPKVQFLGHVIDSQGSHVDPAEIESIKDWVSPKTPTQICQFKVLLGSEDFVVYCNASHKGLGVVLMQREKKELNIRKRRWLEFLSDYDYEIRYHSGKENVVADALSMKELIKPLRVRALVIRRCRRYDQEGSTKGEVGTTSLQKALGTSLDMSTAYHPHTDRQSERIIKTLEDMPCTYMIDFGNGWVKHLPLVEFSYNNSYHASIKAASFEALYDQKCHSPVCLVEVGQVLEKVGSVAYKLELLEELSRVHSTFHVSNLKKCYSEEPLTIPLDGLHIDDKLHFMEEPIEIMDREVRWLKQS
uniref:Reverse transcriptase domain-containing protein n=1 Tax=Tanacetum cinerariifolium TaxID=118510 RepID=A0A6L2J579_TANCI|nr:reverse transcriptase domain-containing protein [Tanacetum cinerariifolium]